MGTALQNIDRLLAMPYGCGEQNMVRFAPNIYIQQYLEKSGQLSPEIRHKAQGFLQSGECPPTSPPPGHGGIRAPRGAGWGWILAPGGERIQD